MGKDPTVTVIVPTYNMERFLSDALRSVQAQTFYDWECLVVDDASEDSSYNVARAFSEWDPRIVAIRMPKNGGAAKAFNAALDSARGRYVACLAADDAYFEQFLEKCVETLNKNTMASGVYTGYVEWWQEENWKGPMIARVPPPFDRTKLLIEDYINFGALLMRNVQRLDSNWEPVSDWEALLRMTRRFPLVRIPELLAARRMHGGQTTFRRKRAMLTKALSLPFHYAPVRIALWSAARRLYFHSRAGLSQVWQGYLRPYL